VVESKAKGRIHTNTVKLPRKKTDFKKGHCTVQLMTSGTLNEQHFPIRYNRCKVQVEYNVTLPIILQNGIQKRKH